MNKLRFDMTALVVPDYDAGIAFYRDILGFNLVEDTELGGGKRWVVFAPGDDGGRLLLAKAASEAQTASIGNQTGGRVAFFLHTEDFTATHAAFSAKGVKFQEEPRQEVFGTVAVFSDPFGNLWDLIEPKGAVS